MSDFFCFAHRGACAGEPENTLVSIMRALEQDVPWIEVDVFAVENELVVIHDDRLERTTDGIGYVMDQPLPYLRSLNAGRGERIPLLREVFDLVSGRAGINVELKGPSTAGPAAELISGYLKRGGWNPELLLVSSFNHPELKRFHDLLPEVRIGALTTNIPLGYARFAEELGAYSVHASLEFIDRAFVEDAHARGLKFFVYTVNYPEDIVRMRDFAVDGIFTDFPERALAGEQI